MNTFFLSPSVSLSELNVANVHSSSSSGGSSLIETVSKECAILPFILAYKSFRRAPNVLHLKYVISSPKLWRSCYQTLFSCFLSACLFLFCSHTTFTLMWNDIVFSRLFQQPNEFLSWFVFFVRFFLFSLFLSSHFPHCFSAIPHDDWFNGLT